MALLVTHLLYISSLYYLYSYLYSCDRYDRLFQDYMLSNIEKNSSEQNL